MEDTGWYCNSCELHIALLKKDDHIASQAHKDSFKAQQLKLISAGSNNKYKEGGEETGGQLYSDESTASDDESDDDESDDDEESESDDRSGDEESHEEYDGDQDHEAGENPLLWSCSICAITINIFAREDHLHSRGHARNAKSDAHATATPTAAPNQPLVPLWTCTICDEEMNIFSQADHLIGKYHRKMLYEQGIAQDPALDEVSDITTISHQHDDDHLTQLHPIPARIPSPSYEPVSTFYCITCAEEFPLSVQDQHIGTSDKCDVCGRYVHLDYLKEHLKNHNAQIEAKAGGGAGTFYCRICDGWFPENEGGTHASQRWHCFVCTRDLHSDWRSTHMERHEERGEIIKSTSQGYSHSKSKQPVNTGARAYNTQQPFTFGGWLESVTRIGSQSQGQPLMNANAKEFYPQLSGITHGARRAQADPSGQEPQVTIPEITLPKTPSVPVPPNLPIKAPKDAYCTICKKYKTTEGMKRHKQSKKHKRKAGEQTRTAKTQRKATKVTKSQAPGVATGFRTVAVVPKDKFYCEVCKKYKNIGGRDDHLRSKKHRKKAAAQQAPSQVPQPAPVSGISAQAPTPARIRPSKNHLYCDVCMTYKHHNGMQGHIKGKTHRKNVASKKPGYQVPGFEKFPALVPPRNNTKQAQQSETASGPGQDMISIFQPNSNMPDIQRVPPPTIASIAKNFWAPAQKFYHCDICSMTVETTSKAFHEARPWRCVLCGVTIHWEGMAMHISGTEHCKKQQQKEVTSKKVNPPPAPALPPTTHTANSFENFFCEICDSQFPMSVRKFHAGPLWQCTLCDITLHFHDKQAHVWSPEHTHLLNQYLQTSAPPAVPKMFFCTTCNDVFDISFQPYHRSQPWECGFCKTTIHSDWIGPHLESDEHAANLSHAPSLELFYCKTCQEYFEEQHMSPEWECGLCQIVMHVEWVESHINGDFHLKNLQLAQDRELLTEPHDATITDGDETIVS